MNLDAKSESGSLLQSNIKTELRKYLGKAYNDDVLPEYIVVMLAHNNTEDAVTESLNAFLDANSRTFTTW